MIIRLKAKPGQPRLSQCVFYCGQPRQENHKGHKDHPKNAKEFLMSLIFPFKTMLDLNNGALEPNGHTTKRYLQDMLTAYTDSEAVTQILQQEGNRLIYEVQGVNLPEETGQILYGTTTIYPGQIGEE